jgi:hypothetical protein
MMLPESSERFYKKLEECRSLLYTSGMITKGVSEAITQRIEKQRLYEEKLYEEAYKPDAD